MGPRTSILRGVFFGIAMPAGIALVGMLLGPAQPRAVLPVPGISANQDLARAVQGDSGDTRASIRVQHLTPPLKAPSDAAVYIAWLRPQNTAKQNSGALALKDGLKGSLDTLTPHFRLLAAVTPGVGGQAPQPAQGPAFSSEVAHLE